MALPYPTFINFKWYKTLWPELSLALLVQSPHLSSFPISTGSLSTANKFQSRHPNVQGPFYSTTCLPLQPHILPSTQSFAAFLQSVVLSPLLLLKSGIIYLPPLKYLHHLTPSNVTSKHTILIFLPPSDSPHL